MKIARILLMLLIAFASSEALAGQFAFYLAYPVKKPNTKSASFPNDKMYRYMSDRPYISSADLHSARVRKSRYGYAVEIEISQTAQDKINAIVSRNLVSLKNDNDLSAFIGLGVVVDGTPVEVIQGMLHPITGKIMWCSVSGTGKSTDESLHIARVWAMRINNAK